MLKILFEDEHILVCEKPAGVATQAGKVTEKDMVSEVNNYLRKAGASSSAYLIHRLDKPVRGILLFAKNKQAAAKLNSQLTEDAFEKRYYALVEGLIEEKNEIELVNYIYKDGNMAVISDKDIKKVKDSKGKEAEIKVAKLKYKVLTDKSSDILTLFGIKGTEDLNNDQSCNSTCVLDIKLLTGRFHQIRCQLSYMGNPIVGDSMYGSTLNFPKRNAIGLIAYSLSFKHPVTKKSMKFSL